MNVVPPPRPQRIPVGLSSVTHRIKFARIGGDLTYLDGEWRLQPLTGGGATRLVYDTRVGFHALVPSFHGARRPARRHPGRFLTTIRNEVLRGKVTGLLPHLHIFSAQLRDSYPDRAAGNRRTGRGGEENLSIRAGVAAAAPRQWAWAGGAFFLP